MASKMVLGIALPNTKNIIVPSLPYLQ
ncbi:hypothetical protein CEXT_513181, partial [Caerostris extrusa]